MAGNVKARKSTVAKQAGGNSEALETERRVLYIKDLLVHLIGFDEHGKAYGRPACEQFPKVWRPLRYELRKRGFAGQSDRQLMESWLEFLEFELEMKRTEVLHTPMLHWRSLLGPTPEQSESVRNASESMVSGVVAKGQPKDGPKSNTQPSAPDSNIVEAEIDGLSMDGRTLVWGGKTYALTETAARMMRILVDHFPRFVSEEFLKLEGEFSSPVRRIVEYNRLVHLVVKDETRRGRWRLKDPSSLVDSQGEP